MLQRILCAIMVVVGLLAHGNTYAADEANKLELPPKIEVEKGTAQLQLPISLTNAVALTGFQCDLYLPDGFTILADEYGDYLIDLARTTPKRHNLATREMPDGALRIVLSSMTNATFSGNSGAVLSITLAIGKDVAAGSYDVNLKNVVLTDPSAARYSSTDVSGSIVVKGSEVVISEDVRLELSPEITREKGVYEFQMPILLTNKEDITGFQCDLFLPDGFSVAKDEYDDYLIDVARTTTKRHSIATREMPDGAVRIVLSSMTNATFSGNSGAVLNVTIAVSSNAEVGNYVVGLRNIVLTNPYAIRYTSADVIGMLVIVEQPVTITAQNLTMVYGEKVPTLTYSSTGAELKGVPSLSCEANSSSPVGTYPIVVSMGTVENKEVTYVNGTLTITKAPLNISVGNYAKKQGDALPEFTLTYTGFKNNETKEVLTIQPSVACEATSATAPGKYDIVVNGAEAQNYEISYTKGTLTITEADPVKVTAKSYTREYGDANPTFEYTVEGAAIDGRPEIICEATATSPVGVYPILIKKGSVTNYNDTYVNGVLTITKAPLRISVGSYEKKQYGPMPEFSVSYTGFKNNETKDVLTKQPMVSCQANEDSPPGEYTVTVSGAEATNYQIQYIEGKLTVTEPDSYTLTYMVNGEVYQSFSIKYRDVITPMAVPTKEGYTFSGWSEIPATMPAHDVVVSGSFTINQYVVTFKIGDEVISRITQNYETAIVAPEAPIKEGHTFAGWGDVAATVPAHDVTYIGSYIVNSYTLTYLVDGEVYETATLAYGTAISPEAGPTKEGYTFSGWDGLPMSMPAKDVIVKGYFTINSYTITYVLDGEVYVTETLEYGAKIVPPVIPGLEDYTIWEDVPATTPSGDITIYGKAKDIIDSLTPVFSNGIGYVYDLNGRLVSSSTCQLVNYLKMGLNIIRMSDGTTRKVLVK